MLNTYLAFWKRAPLPPVTAEGHQDDNSPNLDVRKAGNWLWAALDLPGLEAGSPLRALLSSLRCFEEMLCAQQIFL